jgi:mono/diheme cytochrome c family protein
LEKEALMRLLSAALALCVAALLLGAWLSPKAVAQNDDVVARGRYLVRDAGKCGDCHGAKLRGMYLGFLKPGMPVKYRSARIAGLPQLSVAAAVHFLETGILPNGKPAAPPMPQYRFNEADAQAIVAYLKTLK